MNVSLVITDPLWWNQRRWPGESTDIGPGIRKPFPCYNVTMNWLYGDYWLPRHYDDVIMNAIASQITCLMIVYSIVYSDADQRKHQSSALLAFVWGIHRGPVNSPHKWPITRKMFPFDDVIMIIPPPSSGSLGEVAHRNWYIHSPARSRGRLP